MLIAMLLPNLKIRMLLSVLLFEELLRHMRLFVVTFYDGKTW